MLDCKIDNLLTQMLISGRLQAMRDVGGKMPRAACQAVSDERVNYVGEMNLAVVALMLLNYVMIVFELSRFVVVLSSPGVEQLWEIL